MNTHELSSGKVHGTVLLFMPRAKEKSDEKAKEENISAGRFPLVHELVKFADIRRHYREMREALKASNRSKGSYQGWVTRWKNKFEASELKNQKLEIEIKQVLSDKQQLGDQIREISEKFQGMGQTLAKLEAFEAAVDHLSEIKAIADDQQRATGHWSANATQDLSRAVDTFLETVDEILQEDSDENRSEDAES